MKAPYRQTASMDATLRAHGCTLFSTLYLQRWASEGDVSPETQEAIDANCRQIRDKAGVTMAEFLARGTTLGEAEQAFEGDHYRDRLPPRMRLMHGGSVRDDVLPELRAGNLANVAVNYGVIQDAGKASSATRFRGGHSVVIGEPENGTVAVADPLRVGVVRWSIDLLEKAMETFGSRPWGNGRGEAAIAYVSPTYQEAYATARAALKSTEALLAKRTEQRDEAKAMTALVTEERDTARRDLAACQAAHEATQADLAAVTADLDAANARIAELEGHDGEAPIETPPMEFSYLDVPVVDGFATLPDGTRIASTSDIVRLPVLSTAA
jgi:hypothetical protein